MRNTWPARYQANIDLFLFITTTNTARTSVQLRRRQRIHATSISSCTYTNKYQKQGASTILAWLSEDWTLPT